MSSETKVFKAAVVQAAPVILDKERTIAKISNLTQEAAGNGAKLVVFPEGFISAYPRGFSFGLSNKGRTEYVKYHKSAIEVPSSDTEKLGNIAKMNKVYLVVGVIEKDGGTVFCTAVFLSPEGNYLGKHRKLVPTEQERVVWGRGDGSTIPVFDTPLGKIGSVICWENYMPLLRTAMYSKGIQIYLAITVDGSDTWHATMRHIAMEGRCFVFSCNQFLSKEDYAAAGMEWTDIEEGILNTAGLGGSCIVDPFGKVLAGPNYTEECILYADIDLDQVTKGKLDFDVVGHYGRPDIFSLRVNETACPHVVIVNQNGLETKEG